MITYRAALDVQQPANGRELDISTRTRNAVLRSLRCLGERGFALLIGRWRALQHITANPSKIGSIARAALILTFRVPLHQMKIAEITSLRPMQWERCLNALHGGRLIPNLSLNSGGNVELASSWVDHLYALMPASTPTS